MSVTHPQLAFPTLRLLPFSSGAKVKLTVAHDKQIDTENGKSLADTVIRVLEHSLHDSRIDLDQHYSG